MSDVTWESVAMVGAIGTMTTGIIGALFYGLHKMVYTIRAEGSKNRQQTETMVVQANGSPLAMIKNSRTPMWFKKYRVTETGIPEFRMSFLNGAYTVAFGHTLESYVGKRDADVWPDEVSRKFFADDLFVAESRTSHEFRERIPTPDGKVEEWVVIKYPYLDQVTGQVLGVGGEAHRAPA